MGDAIKADHRSKRRDRDRHIDKSTKKGLKSVSIQEFSLKRLKNLNRRALTESLRLVVGLVSQVPLSLPSFSLRHLLTFISLLGERPC